MNREYTELEKKILEVVENKNNWSLPSSRKVALILDRKGHTDIHAAMKRLDKNGAFDKYKKIRDPEEGMYDTFKETKIEAAPVVAGTDTDEPEEEVPYVDEERAEFLENQSHEQT